MTILNNYLWGSLVVVVVNTSGTGILHKWKNVLPSVIFPTVSQSYVPFTHQQVSVPSTSPPPYPPFKRLSSDIRVNACWVVALVCNLSAALLASLVQQWVRSYMQVFQRYDNPLKRARFRQFFSRVPKECGAWQNRSPG